MEVRMKKIDEDSNVKEEGPMSMKMKQKKNWNINMLKKHMLLKEKILKKNQELSYRKLKRTWKGKEKKRKNKNNKKNKLISKKIISYYRY